jgi:hypothetical protein
MDKDNDILQEAIDARIDSFLRGEMTPDEESAFKQEIQADPELRAQVKATVALIRGIRNQNEAQEKTIIAKYNKSRVRSILTWACSVAAMFVVFFGVKNELRYRELSGIVNPYYSEYNMSEASRGDVDSVTVTVAHLYTLFNNIKEQRSVSDIIEELEPIYLALDSDFTYSAYANDIAWNLALAYIKDDQIDKAIPVLEKLEEDNPDMPIAVKASELKQKLQKLQK